MHLLIEKVTKKFGEFTAVNEVSLSAEEGEFIVLLGPSGCGKSTLLRMVAGLESADSGKIILGGRDLTPLGPAERDLAMVFQSYALYPHMSVRENISYPLRIRKKPPHEIQAEVASVAGKLGLTDLLDRRPKELSGGQRQRVALARAMVRRARAFLMDEPLSNLDARLRIQMRAELKRLHRELAKTTLYVTHDQSEAMTLASRIAVLDQGRILQYAPPKTIYRQPVNIFVAGFVGSPAMNLVKGRLEEDSFQSAELNFPLSPTARGLTEGPRDVIVGFRPEDVEVSLAEPSGGRKMCAGKVFVTEELGDESFVLIGLGGAERTTVTVRISPDLKPVDDAPIWFLPRPEKLHVFDGTTGRNRLF